MSQAQWIKLHLPSTRHIGRFLLWAVGRCLISSWLFTLYSTTVLCKGIIQLAELTRQATINLLKVYDQLPYMGTLAQNIIEVSAVAVSEPKEIITDIVTAIAEKQLMIIGGTGAGKSTVAQYLAYTVGGKVRVLECEGTPDDWVGLEVVGRGENWAAIEATMQNDLEEMTRRVQLREQQGDKALIGLDEITIVEEYPEVRTKCDTADEWFERHGRRGRKLRRWVICLSQYDKVAAWGLEGKSDLADCFYKLRLGKVAVNHAKSIKNDELINWLKSDRSHCLLDDQPCKLPPYQEMKAVTKRLQLPPQNQSQKTPEMLLQQAFQPVNTEVANPPAVVEKAVLACLEAGLSDSKIIKEVLGYQGSQYTQGKKILEVIKSRL